MGMKKLFLGVIVLAAVLLGFYLFAQNSKTTEPNPDATSLEFIMAHKPDNEDNVALVQEFADRVLDRTGGMVTVDLVLPPDSLRRSWDKDVHQEAIKSVYSGEAAMAQAAINRFPELYPDLYPLNAFDAPGVFKDHEHAARVLDGAVGDAVREVVKAETEGKLIGFAFTYSGGLRNLVATTPISSLADLRGMTIRYVRPMSRSVMQKLGITPLQDVKNRDEEWRTQMLTGSMLEEAENIRTERYRNTHADVAEAIDTIVETEHSMYLTMITMNGPIFESLSPEHQVIIEEEAYRLADKERKLSIRQGNESKKGFEADGVTFVALSVEDQATLDQVLTDVRSENSEKLGKWFEDIAAVQ